MAPVAEEEKEGYVAQYVKINKNK
uniref:Uncharacterized protein n=1 Tax=Rhizophora mucronata TaxID=61149 RepID=A0A2P2Q4P8_RHIMU